MTSEEIKRAREICDAATPTDVTRDDILSIKTELEHWNNNCGGCETCSQHFGNRTQPEFNLCELHLICCELIETREARTLLPKALDELEIARYQFDRLKALCDHQHNDILEERRKLQIAVEALETIRSWCQNPGEHNHCIIAECETARAALEKLK